MADGWLEDQGPSLVIQNVDPPSDQRDREVWRCVSESREEGEEASGLYSHSPSRRRKRLVHLRRPPLRAPSRYGYRDKKDVAPTRHRQHTSLGTLLFFRIEVNYGRTLSHHVLQPRRLDRSGCLNGQPVEKNKTGPGENQAHSWNTILSELSIRYPSRHCEWARCAAGMFVFLRSLSTACGLTTIPSLQANHVGHPLAFNHDGKLRPLIPLAICRYTGFPAYSKPSQ